MKKSIATHCTRNDAAGYTIRTSHSRDETRKRADSPFHLARHSQNRSSSTAKRNSARELYVEEAN